jgi:hypothetical protein
MVLRNVASLILLSSSLAVADTTIELVPSCADIDAQRDTLDPDARARAVRQLTRVLERAQLLVVTVGCVDRYVASHEQAGGALVVRIAGPHGSRRIRNGSVDQLDAMYARMVASLLEPITPELESRPAPIAEPARVEAAAIDPYSEGDHDPVIDAVAHEEIEIAPDRILYGQLAAGSFGAGWGLGYRRAASEHAALDVSATFAGDDSRNAVALGVEVLYVPHPRAVWTPYVGGGLSVASQSEGYMTGAGARAEMTAGISFSRAGASRWFAQLDAALPMFSQQDDSGDYSYAPSVGVALGLGF